MRARKSLPTLLVLTAAVAAVVFVGAAVGSAKGPRVHLPRDHYAHPAAGIEWWYVTGLVRGADGKRYSVFYTLFKRAGFLLPVSQVVNLDTGALVGHSETLAKATLTASRLDVSVSGGSLRYQQPTNIWRFAAATPGYALALVARPEKAYVLHGAGSGLIEQSAANTSFYYSATRMAAQGTITHNGHRIPFTGTAWLDHQWGNFQNNTAAFNWYWFSCRFDDDTELMLYEFHTPTGVPLRAQRNGTYVPKTGPSRPITDFEAQAGSRLLTAAGHRWPLDWRIQIPSERLSLELTSITRDQLVRGTLLPTFWEGAATATGTKPGTCFVEQSYQ